MADPAKKLLQRIQTTVWKKQRRNLARYRGRRVRRNGVDYTVVRINTRYTIVSRVGMPLGQTQRMSTRAFLGKRIEVLDG